jgi:hypothetical protein
MNMAIYVKFHELSDDKREELVELVSTQLIQEWMTEAREFMTRDWGTSPKPQTWQEAYIRMYSIEDQMWSEYENGKEARPSDKDWVYWLEDYATEEAENKLYDAFKYVSLEVEL